MSVKPAVNTVRHTPLEYDQLHAAVVYLRVKGDRKMSINQLSRKAIREAVAKILDEKQREEEARYAAIRNSIPSV